MPALVSSSVGEGWDFHSQGLESSNSITSLVVEKGNKIRTPAEGLRDGRVGIALSQHWSSQHGPDCYKVSIIFMVVP